MKKINLYAKYQVISKISVVDIYQMYSIYSKYYENTKWRIFLSDLSKKSGAFVIRRKEDKRIVGFSTVVNYTLTHQGKSGIGVFSGDTIIEKEYWGTRVLQVAFYKYMLGLKFKNPTKNIYWLLISKGFKTYLLMSNNFEKYYPSVDSKHDELSKVVDNYCEDLFPEYYDKDARILDFGNRYQALKEGVADIDEGMLSSHAKISFFEQRNPEWRRGTELPCVGVVDWPLLLGYVKKYLKKPASKGALKPAVSTKNKKYANALGEAANLDLRQSA